MHEGKVIHVSLVSLNQSRGVYQEPSVQVVEPVGGKDHIPDASDEPDPVFRSVIAANQTDMSSHRLRGVFQTGRSRQASLEAQRIPPIPVRRGEASDGEGIPGFHRLEETR